MYSIHRELVKRILLPLGVVLLKLQMIAHKYFILCRAYGYRLSLMQSSSKGARYTTLTFCSAKHDCLFGALGRLATLNGQ